MRAIYDYIIYTDGGCECNPGGRGGYGAVIINNNTGELTDISGGFRSTTNNRMEVMAVIKALEKIEKDTHIQLFSDSQYVIKTMNGMFRKKKNIDLWKKLDKLAVAFIDHFAETKYQMMCIRWCARGLALGDAIKKVQVDMEVAENCLANKKRNM